MKDRKLQLIDKLQPYVNGKLITSWFIKYWNELRGLIENENVGNLRK